MHKWNNQPIKITKKFCGSDVTELHLRQTYSDVFLGSGLGTWKQAKKRLVVQATIYIRQTSVIFVIAGNTRLCDVLREIRCFRHHSVTVLAWVSLISSGMSCFQTCMSNLNFSHSSSNCFCCASSCSPLKNWSTSTFTCYLHVNCTIQNRTLPVIYFSLFRERITLHFMYQHHMYM